MATPFQGKSVDPRAALRAVVRRQWNLCTDSDGRLDKSEVRALVRAEVEANLAELVDIDGMVSKAVDDFDRDISEPKDDGQTSFFQPDGYFALGDAERVLQAKAVLADLVRWAALQAEQAAAQMTKQAKKGTWAASRISKWKAEYRTLLEVETKEFGFKPKS